MMRTAMALTLLALLVLCGVDQSATQEEGNTFVSNQSSRTITATTSYRPNASGTSSFINRIIPPHTYQSDTYTRWVDEVNIEVWVKGSASYNSVEVIYDRSIVAYDNWDHSGVDIYLAVYGTRVHKDGDPLITIYP